MEKVIDSIRRVISKWVDVQSPIVEDINPGDTIIKVRSAIRFQIGDEVMFKNGSQYETGMLVTNVYSSDPYRYYNPDTIVVSSPAKHSWKVSDGASIVRCYAQQFVQGIYFGDPEVIPRYPAIAVVGDRRESSWITLQSTSEHYDITINVYVKASTEEAGYRFLLKVSRIIEKGLKQNIFPLVGNFQAYELTADALSGDKYLKVASTAEFPTKPFVVSVEDIFKQEYMMMCSVIDDTTISLSKNLYYDFLLEDNPVIIIPTRVIYSSWTPSTDYIKIHKGDLLKGASISWFAEEQEIQDMLKTDPQIS